MIAFAKANPYFERLNTCLLGLSVDSNPSHLAWIYDIYCRTGIVIPFPIIADRNGQISTLELDTFATCVKIMSKNISRDYKRKKAYK